MFKTILKNFTYGLTSRYYCNQYSETVKSILQKQEVGDQINIKGWIRSMRKQKENVFIDINDGSTEKKLQIVLRNELLSEGVGTGASVSVVGTLKQSPKGQIEVHAQKVELYGKCVITDGYPFAPRKQYPPEYIREYLHLRPRTNRFSSLLRVRSTAILAIHEYFNREGFINIQTPILTSNDCEGAGEVFQVIPHNNKLLKTMVKEGLTLEEAFFDTKVFLTVSGQLHLEASAHGLGKVYTLGPTFRAENSKTRFHLSEFYMLEAEIAFLNRLEHLTNNIENMIKDVTTNVLEQCANSQILRENSDWLTKKFPILTYDEAVNIIKQNPDYVGTFEYEQGFSKEHELFLVQHVGNIPVFIINWPQTMKPFYMKTCDEDNTKVAAVDLLAPHVGELVGGSLRENDYNVLKSRIPHQSNRLDWYLDLRKYGSVPTGGYGLGFERFLSLILDVNNIKDALPFPRWPHNCDM